MVPAVEKYLKPFLLGKPADRIDDTWQACYNSSYWRNGPVLNNAISGVDQALWDIKGRQAGMPVYQLLGGKMREAADCYAHASGAEIPEVVEAAKSFMAQGFRHVRIQVGVPGMAGYGGGGGRGTARGRRRCTTGRSTSPGLHPPRGSSCSRRCASSWATRSSCCTTCTSASRRRQAAAVLQGRREVPAVLRRGPVVAGGHRLVPHHRQQCSTPLAMGELFNSPHEWTPLIAERLIDYIRVHVSQAGGLTPCRKIAAIWARSSACAPPGTVPATCRRSAMRPTWRSTWPPKLRGAGERVLQRPPREIFKGLPEVKNGYLYANEAPGWGIEVDEKAAAKYPFGGPTENQNRVPLNGGWGEVRRRDGTIIKQ